ncbi:phosphatase PAP2 family protein [Petropleomorpha daqingensis]|uniref:tRNA A-37 threonylcarbamoyl transferase component Bud32/membrane-associated phospholipid phosphatase n=1 Tax=Petropleomorpha daqingensis TaxID=2026353 RepID=A0A853CD14_9ACTN|nr:phosphatase PAP2 family protein [Petropleomorpha daqingensis]NYJ04989.1 tRNA A-37 threonylcarbamoyl transferase component Bud32/membrane-associated phospholipid phosphatase [Petropleomorpha daqingensis]
MATLPPAATAAGTVARPAPPALRRVRRRRRPSGEPPPLPRHLAKSGKWWLVASGVVVLAWIAVWATGSVSVFDLADTRVLQAFESIRSPALTRVATVTGVLATPAALQVIWLANLVALIVIRRWRHLFVWLGTGLLVVVLASGMALALQRPRPFEVEILGRWAGFSMPSLPMTVLAAFLVSTVYALVPAGRHRTEGKWIVLGLLVVTAVSRLYTAQDHPTDIAAAVILGVALPLAAFRLLTPNDVYPVRYRRGRAAHLDVTGPRGDAIVRALQDQLGLLATSVTPFGLSGSGGSTPLKITVKSEDGESTVFGKLYAATHVRSDRWYKLGRTLLYGRLEDEQPYHSVRRLVQYEDYVLRLLDDAGLPVGRPLGIVEITPEREYLLVNEFVLGSTEIGDAEIDEGIIDQGLAIVRRMWEVGVAHRDIKPANLLVRDGQLVVIDTAFAEVRPSPWRQAVDLANMMLVLGLRTDARRVYDRAVRQFTDEEIAEAFAATRGLTMPTQLRRMLRQQGRDLHAEFLALLPYRLPPVRIQRWSWRRVGLTVATLLVLLLAVLIAVPLLTGSPL